MSSPNLILCRYVPIAPSRLFKLYVLSHISLRCVAPSKFWKCTLLPVVWYKTLISGEKVALRKSPTAFLGFVVMRAINQELSNLPFASWEIFDKKCKTLQFNGNKIKKEWKMPWLREEENQPILQSINIQISTYLYFHIQTQYIKSRMLFDESM